MKGLANSSSSHGSVSKVYKSSSSIYNRLKGDNLRNGRPVRREVVVKAGYNQDVNKLFCGFISQEGANSENFVWVKAARFREH